MKQYLALPMTGAASVVLGSCCLLALAPDVQGFQDPPPYIHLTGIVRDFRKSHPDFQTPTGDGFGHHAGNVAHYLGEDHRPSFSGAGFRVDAQWRDRLDRPIAPHLFGGWGAGAVLLAGSPVISGAATVDTWDAAVGPYGGANVGPEPTMAVGATMPEVKAPGGMQPSVGDLAYDGAGVSVLSSDVHCDALSIRDLHRLRIDGQVDVLCGGMFSMRDGAAIELTAGSSLRLYVLGDVEIQDSTINDGFYDPSRFTIYKLGAGQVRIQDGADVYGTIIAPAGTVIIGDDANLYGALAAAGLKVTDSAGLHIDARMPYDQCGHRLDDSAGTAGASGAGGITSAASFAQWFHDVPGVNISARKVITLIRDDAGMYEFVTNNFLPIDDRLYGNEGDAHNYYFTYAINGRFDYDACAGQIFEFQGNDDAWLFVDGKLAMDIGGLLPSSGQTVDMDRLGLADGETHSFLFLYAHRQGTFADFLIRTNIVLTTDDIPIVVTGMFD